MRKCSPTPGNFRDRLDKDIALITDGRFSGGTRGASIGHVSPEASGEALVNYRNRYPGRRHGCRLTEENSRPGAVGRPAQVTEKLLAAIALVTSGTGAVMKIPAATGEIVMAVTPAWGLSSRWLDDRVSLEPVARHMTGKQN